MGPLGGMAGCCCPGKGLGPPGAPVCATAPGPPAVGARPGRGPCGGTMLGVTWGGPLKLAKKIAVYFSNETLTSLEFG